MGDDCWGMACELFPQRVGLDVWWLAFLPSSAGVVDMAPAGSSTIMSPIPEI